MVNAGCVISSLEASDHPRPGIDTVVLSAYDVAIGLAGWRRVAATLAKALDGPSLAILLFDERGSKAEVLAIAGRMDQARVEACLATVRRMAIRRGRASRQGEARRHRQEERWNSFSEAVADYYLAGMSIVGASESRWLFVAVDIARLATSERIHEMVDPVLPHFCRAAEIDRSLRVAAQRSFFSGAVFDRLPIGLVHLGSDESVIYSNAEADRLSGQREGFTIASGRARASSSADDAALQAAIHEAVDPRKGPFSGWLNVRRCKSRRPYRVLVTTLSRSHAVAGDDTCCALFIIDPERPSMIRPKAIADAFGLTAGEAKVVAHLTMGLSLTEIAEQLKVSINTVRTLLARAMGKTMTNTQVALLRVVLTTLIPVGESPH